VFGLKREEKGAAKAHFMIAAPDCTPNQGRCEKSAIDIVHSSVFQQYFFKTQAARR